MTFLKRQLTMPASQAPALHHCCLMQVNKRTEIRNMKLGKIESCHILYNIMDNKNHVH